MIELFVVTFTTRWHRLFMEMVNESADTSWSRSGKLTLPFVNVWSDLRMIGGQGGLLSAPIAKGSLVIVLWSSNVDQLVKSKGFGSTLVEFGRKWRNRLYLVIIAYR